MFQLCKEPDGYFIYYDDINKKLRGFYNTEADVKPDYSILLVQPFIIAGVKILDNWIRELGGWYSYLAFMLAILLTTISMEFFYKKIAQSRNAVLSRRFRELPEPTKEEWEYYLGLAEQQLKQHTHIEVWLGIGIIGCVIAFVWSRTVIFLLLYSVLYLILHLFISEEKPIRKYKLIKAGKKAPIF